MIVNTRGALVFIVVVVADSILFHCENEYKTVFSFRERTPRSMVSEFSPKAFEIIFDSGVLTNRNLHAFSR
jgi:hypothetical protein